MTCYLMLLRGAVLQVVSQSPGQPRYSHSDIRGMRFTVLIMALVLVYQVTALKKCRRRIQVVLEHQV